jgi:3-methyladenine DNA glycosylase AlkD
VRPRRPAPRRADRALIEAVRPALARVADAERAPRMQAYMKSAMPYLGVPSPVLKREMSALAKQYPPADAEVWRDTILALFREATYREEWYAALDLAGRTRFRFEPSTLPMFEEIVVTGAWWDIVLWKRRVAIICQLGHRADTDLDLLTDAIEANLADRDFFIRKAIGWALREYAKHDMPWVLAYVAGLGPRISPLSRREALKHAPAEGSADTALGVRMSVRGERLQAVRAK